MARARDQFEHQYEKFSNALDAITPPLKDGEEGVFKYALQSCDFAFNHFDTEQVKDKEARCWLDRIRELTDTAGVADVTGEGTPVARVRSMSCAEKLELFYCLDRLVDWLNAES